MLTEEGMANLEQRLLEACRKAEEKGFRIGNGEGYCCPFQALMGRCGDSQGLPGPMSASMFLTDGDDRLGRDIEFFMEVFDGRGASRGPMGQMGARFRERAQKGGFR